LIAPDIVLSAAHCNLKWAPNTMLVGAYKSNTASSGGVYRTIAEKREHPRYKSSTNENDLLLIRLDQPVKSVQPVKLSFNTNNKLPADGKALTVIGLGTTKEGGKEPSNKILRKVVVNAMSTSKCNARYYGMVKSSMLCAGKETILSMTKAFRQTKSPR
jgi:hypothetical protein